jgi:fluoride exporter
MTVAGFLAVGVGAVLGAWLRWLLGLALNGIVPHLPFGTLVANVAGGFMVGVAVAYFAYAPHVAAEWRLAIVTGFLGALTTFSTFSAESLALIEAGRFGWAAAHSALHLAGSLVATAVGLATFRALA